VLKGDFFKIAGGAGQWQGWGLINNAQFSMFNAQCSMKMHSF